MFGNICETVTVAWVYTERLMLPSGKFTSCYLFQNSFNISEVSN